ncbi:MAG TPA: peptidoglycan DD-metalloendopeptidase family protein [Gammaproteobacteria bacterium]|nr:peptidoglycan DD-metalloendopeptidase family protein [Gammaproteobacteria bacterium]
MRPYAGGIRHDYKDSTPTTRSFDPRGLSYFAVGLVLPLLGVLLLLVSEPNESMVLDEHPLDAATTVPIALLPPDGERVALELLPPEGERVALELPPLPDPPRAAVSRPNEQESSALLAEGEPLTLVVQRNDSLDQLFRRNDLSVADLDAMVKLPQVGRHLGLIRPGDKIEIIRNGRSVLSLRKELSDSQALWIRRENESYKAELIDLEIEIRTAGANGVIESSLWLAASDAGLPANVTQEISGVFEWDIDFFLDVREGDSFTVVYEEIWRDGEKLRDGSIVAAEFVNQGETYRAASYVTPDGVRNYFTPEGMSVKRPFLRNPIEFTRVSSNFNPNRRHPIQNTIRAHRGVDLAAPTGTPIRAAGAGKIVARSAYGSFGNRVEIQHGGNITTLYAHMSRFGSYRLGDRVQQGDVIGYVGMTGGATGPHLHYEYRLNGIHQNPRTVELPDAEAIAREYLADFEASAAPLWHQLDLYQRSLFASTAD